ncbi:hypothetical protein DM586_06765 [Vibrio fluvialis]|uniref:hypothetical protein n=1 Tax=Vibrio fluvialis TaxID=676 RepID=UPI00117F618D|nr:hypothetical protein [Vibrio fluvialis]TRN15725.1 hypothetical protein DM586_06765 [Vibrio fluvialis]
MVLRKQIQESAVCQFVQRNWGLISNLFPCLFVLLFVYGFIILVSRAPDYIEIDELRYSRVYGWYSDENVRPLIASALSDGQISVSEYFEIKNATSSKASLIRMAEGDN